MLALQLDQQGALQAQLYRALRDTMLRGQLQAGQRLPGTRTLARELGVARNTVIGAYAQLEAEAYLRPQSGSGHVVLPCISGATHTTPTDQPAGLKSAALAQGDSGAEPALNAYAMHAAELAVQRALCDPLDTAPSLPSPRLDLRYGLPLSSLPLRQAWRRALNWAAQRAADDYPAAAGLPRLREALASWLGRRRGFRVDPQRILIVSGAQQALDLCVRVLARPQTLALLEDPHYQGTRQILQAAGVACQAVPVDDYGVCTECLPETPHALLFLTPAHQFPSGAVLAPARRATILQWAQRLAAWVIEDDYDSEFRYDAQPVPALKALDHRGAQERVIHIGTWSKSLFPALRLGYVVMPAALQASLVGAKWLSDRGNATIEQLALAQLIESGRLDALLRLASRQLRVRRLALIEVLQNAPAALRLRIEGSCAGMHLCVWIDALPAQHSTTVVAAAAAVGVGVYPVAPYFLRQPAQLGLLLGYAGLPPAELAEAGRRLLAVLLQQQQNHNRTTMHDATSADV